MLSWLDVSVHWAENRGNEGYFVLCLHKEIMRKCDNHTEERSYAGDILSSLLSMMIYGRFANELKYFTIKQHCISSKKHDTGLIST